jgi:hypothetical protein
METDRAWNSATRRARAASRPRGPGKRRPSFEDVLVVVCFLALIGIAAIGGAVIFLSWVTATFPVSPRVACPEFHGCVVPAPDENQDVLGDDHPIDGPMLTP